MKNRLVSIRKNEDGAAAIELAIVAPLLLLLVFGLIEIGLGWRTAQNVVHASAVGARAVTQGGVEESSDQAALRSIKAALNADWENIERVVIYEVPAGGDGEPPASCILPGLTTAASGSNCNIYTKNDLNDVDNAAHFDNGANCGSGRSANWCPSQRDNNLLTAQWAGLWIEYDHTWQTGIFPGSAGKQITKHTVMRIEPRD